MPKSAVQTAIRDACVRAAGLTAQQLAQLEGSPLPEENFDGSRFWVQYGYSILAMMVCLMSASYVIRAVVEEKDSRLVELLLVSVKPMALLAGNGLSNADSSFQARRYLEWPNQFENNLAWGSNIGYKNGALPGVLTTVYYAYRWDDPAAIVVALFYRDLPQDTYRRWRNDLPHDELARWLLADPAAIPALAAAIAP